MATRKPRTLNTPEKMRPILARRDREGWTYHQLARATGIPVSTLTYWKSRLRREKVAPSSAFLPVVVAQPSSPTIENDRAATLFEVAFPSGIRVVVPAGFNESSLVRLVRTLDRC